MQLVISRDRGVRLEEQHQTPRSTLADGVEFDREDLATRPGREGGGSRRQLGRELCVVRERQDVGQIDSLLPQRVEQLLRALLRRPFEDDLLPVHRLGRQPLPPSQRPAGARSSLSDSSVEVLHGLLRGLHDLEQRRVPRRVDLAHHGYHRQEETPQVPPRPFVERRLAP